MRTRKTRIPIRSVYWINIDRSTERKQRMLVFKEDFLQGIQPRRVSALDGSDPSFIAQLKHIQNVMSSVELIYACYPTSKPSKSLNKVGKTWP